MAIENVQAGLGTDILFRAANQRGAMVLGTGDLSEIALGWSTYGVGDPMSDYNVNASVPKTLIQHLIRWVAQSDAFDEETSRTLLSILETVISPELVPAHAGGALQSTEEKIGPYELHAAGLNQRPYRERRCTKPADHAPPSIVLGFTCLRPLVISTFCSRYRIGLR